MAYDPDWNSRLRSHFCSEKTHTTIQRESFSHIQRTIYHNINMMNRLVIGLFGLVGMFGVAMAPLVGRVIDKLVPWSATVVATAMLIIFQALQTAAGGINIAVVVIVSFGIDVFRQTQQVSLTTAVFGLDASARARLNAVLIISVRRSLGLVRSSSHFVLFILHSCSLAK